MRYRLLGQMLLDECHHLAVCYHQAHVFDCILVKVFEREYGIDAVFGLEFALADEEVGYLFGAAEDEVAIAVAVVIITLVGVCLGAFGHIAVYQVQAIYLQGFEFEIIGGSEQLGVVHILDEGVELFLQTLIAHAKDLSAVVCSQDDMPASAVQKRTDALINRTRQLHLRLLEFNLSILAYGKYFLYIVCGHIFVRFRQLVLSSCKAYLVFQKSFLYLLCHRGTVG